MSRTAALELLAVPGLPMIQPGDDLAKLISEGLARGNIAPRKDDVIVVAQKVVSKAEGRSVELATVKPSPRAVELAQEVQKDPRLVELILSESVRVVRSRPNVLIVEHRLGFVMANAGVDQSNVGPTDGVERALLLPLDPDGTAEALRKKLSTKFGVPLAVVITDSFGRAWPPCSICAAIPTCSAAPCRSASRALPTKSRRPPRWLWARATRRSRSCWSAA